MTNCFVHGPAHLMTAWKSLRAGLTADKTDETHLREVVDFWSKSPIGTRMLDWDSPGIWPDPWRFINDMDFDESSVALGMFYTLLLSQDQRWNIDRLRLALVREIEHQVQRIVLMVDQKWILNLDYNHLLEYKKHRRSIIIQQSYSYDGKNHHLEESLRSMAKSVSSST